jgi:RHH-type proline utilization regulon transcriptional repressor/proline dehydrogenase/delta 1-pyrroline-5-carboxylate dehydrogenase
MADSTRQAIADAYFADEDHISVQRIAAAQRDPQEDNAISMLARDLAGRIRSEGARRGGVDALTQEYALSTEEGVALMCLAEALLRVPDNETADLLIRDKIAPGDWESHLGKSDSLFVNASTWGLMLTGRVVRMGPEFGKAAPEWNLQGAIKKIISRSGEPVIRQAIGTAMRMMGGQFVLGRTMREAIRNAREWREKGYRYSFDMLGEAAYTKEDAERHLKHYRDAIADIAENYKDDDAPIHGRPSISVKLSAVHPRYEWIKRARVFDELVPVLTDLAIRARRVNIGLTVDAEEADRHELMLDVFAALLENPELKGWNGLGLAVQAYQKRGLPTIHWLIEMARRHGVRIPVRLVKGAYWDTEIKRAQEAGLVDYPVFTRKAATDTSYIACTNAIFAAPDAIYGMFATHNAHTLAAVDVLGAGRDFEFQRLHGMGEALHEHYHAIKNPGVPTRIYAPVGSHEDLLAYLVRRLLENGANSSFVNRMADAEASLDTLVADPVAALAEMEPKRNPRIPLPRDMLGNRINSQGLLWSDPPRAEPLLAEMKKSLERLPLAAPIVGGKEKADLPAPVTDPSDRTRVIGQVAQAGPAEAREALDLAYNAQGDWDRLGGDGRGKILEHAADLFEQNRASLMALIVREGGKTLQTAMSELREAADFLRYYASEARKNFAPQLMPGPTGESNELTLHGKGVFACISPWNFPLAIFTGQVAGALAAGNAVLAKPAAPTPLIAAAAVRLLHQAGVPVDVLHLLPGSGSKIGAAIFPDPRLAGIVLTGSTEAATVINRALAARDGPIATVIAETGGQNAMIVDSTALPEQVARDAVTSAFDSAGQRCSALRVLFLQDDVADKMLDVVLGAADELRLGDPFDLATDIGPVINESARETLEQHAEKMTRRAKLLKKLPLRPEHKNGVFFPPHVFAIESISVLEREVFGPILHVVRYSAGHLDKVCEAINATGYGLTLGIHTRIESTAAFIRDRVKVGNVYVNRNQIGAVVGVQPFGGEGLSGTGPKAGGPHYLQRMALERTFTVNTTASGGNAALLSSS